MPGAPSPPLFHAFTPKRDHDLWRRRVLAWLLTLLWALTIVGTWALNALLQPFQHVMSKPVEADLVEVEVQEPKLEDAPPAPPPPRAYAPVATPDVPPKPDEAPRDDVKKLSDDVKQEVKAEVISGTPEGVVGGSESGGSGPGVLGGVPGGTGDIVRTFHYSEVAVTKRVQPDYPDEAKKAYRGQEPTCKVRVFINTEGIPYDLKFEECPDVFHTSAQKAVMEWRWAPAQFGGRPVKAQFTITIRYKMT